MDLEVTETDPGFKGRHRHQCDQARHRGDRGRDQGPLFINPGDRIKIDTRTGEYLERCKASSASQYLKLPKQNEGLREVLPRFFGGQGYRAADLSCTVSKAVEAKRSFAISSLSRFLQESGKELIRLERLRLRKEQIMTISEKVAYLKGLAEGLNLDVDKSKEGKLISVMIGILEEIGLSIEDLEENALALGEEIDVLSDDLADVGPWCSTRTGTTGTTSRWSAQL